MVANRRATPDSSFDIGWRKVDWGRNPEDIHDLLAGKMNGECLERD